MKDIKISPSDNTHITIGFNADVVRAFGSEAEFIKDAKKQGHFDGHAEQEELLKTVYQKAAPKSEAPAPAKSMSKGGTTPAENQG